MIIFNYIIVFLRTYAACVFVSIMFPTSPIKAIIVRDFNIAVSVENLAVIQLVMV